jgi:hypothetical protein
MTHIVDRMVDIGIAYSAEGERDAADQAVNEVLSALESCSDAHHPNSHRETRAKNRYSSLAWVELQYNARSLD